MSMNKKEKALHERLEMLTEHIIEQSKLIARIGENASITTAAIRCLMDDMQTPVSPERAKQLLISTPSSTRIGFQ
jgi:hypothetical protein